MGHEGCAAAPLSALLRTKLLCPRLAGRRSLGDRVHLDESGVQAAVIPRLLARAQRLNHLPR